MIALLLRYKWYAFVLLLIVGLALSVLGYRHQYLASLEKLGVATQQLSEAQSTIKGMQKDNADLAALDKKHYDELTQAQSRIDSLGDDLAANRKRLLVHATCSKIAVTSTTSGVDDAGTPRLDDTAQRDYLTLIKRIATEQEQLKALIEFVNQHTEQGTSK